MAGRMCLGEYSGQLCCIRLQAGQTDGNELAREAVDAFPGDDDFLGGVLGGPAGLTAPQPQHMAHR